MFCVESGSVNFSVEAVSQAVQVPCVLLVPPGALHGLQYSEDVKGRILTISDSLIEAIFTGEQRIWYGLAQAQIIDNFAKDGDGFAQILRLMLEIDRELFDEKTGKQVFVKGLLAQLFVLLYRLAHAEIPITNPAVANPSIAHFMHFQKLVKTVEHPVRMGEFAKTIGITSIHLNRICQQVAQKTASQVVQEHLVREAQHYLQYTDHSVSEVAYLLGFEHPNYFAKLFRKQTGQSPSAFRANHQVVSTM